MSDLPQQVMIWRGYKDLEHTGTWSTTRYPEDAVAYVPRARLEAVEADLAYANKRIEHAFERNDRQAQTIDDLTAALATARRVADDAIKMCEDGYPVSAYNVARQVIRALADEAET